MDNTYQILTDATADLSGEVLAQIPNVDIIPMKVEIGGKEYTYSPTGDLSLKEFYQLQRDGQFASTSQINPTVYNDYFEKYLKEGKDILYLCFTSGLSGTVQVAYLCMDELRSKYPERKLICIDTLCAAVGEGFLVREAAKKQMAGASIDELADWTRENRLKVCHWFYVDTFEHLLHGGRVSATSAALGSTLQIKPLLHVDEQGSLQVKSKPRGRKKAMSLQIEKMEQGWQPELGKLVIIGHGDDEESANILKQKVASKFPEAEIYLQEIGPIIGAHTGPNMVALIYWGNNR